MINLNKVKELLQQELSSGVTKYKLARLIKIPPSSLSNYLYADIEPRYVSLQKIADYFNVPVSYFVSEEPLPPGLTDLTDDEQTLLRMYRRITTEEGRIAIKYQLKYILFTQEYTPNQHQGGTFDGKHTNNAHEQ